MLHETLLISVEFLVDVTPFKLALSYQWPCAPKARALAITPIVQGACFAMPSYAWNCASPSIGTSSNGGLPQHRDTLMHRDHQLEAYTLDDILHHRVRVLAKGLLGYLHLKERAFFLEGL